MRRSILLVSLAMLWMQGCLEINPEEPALLPFAEAPSAEESILNLPLVLPLSEVQRKINDALTEVIYRDTSYNEQTKNIKLTISRLENIQVRPKGKKLQIEVPLQLDIRALFHKRVIGFDISKEQDFTFSLKVAFETTLGLHPELYLQSNMELTNIEWIEKPFLNLALFQINLSGKVEKILEEKKDELSRMIDQVIAKEVNLRKTVEKIWEDLQKPILITQRPVNLWLLVEPEDLQFQQPYWDSKNIYVNLQLKAKARNTFQKEAILEKHSFPERAGIIKKNEKDFTIRIFSSFPFESFNQVLQDSLVGRTFDLEGREIQIREAMLSGSGEKIILKLRVKGSSNGIIYFEGTPQYNDSTRVLRINDFDFSVQSQEVLTRLATWFFQDSFREEIQKHLEFPLKEEMQKVPQLIQQGIEKGKSGESIRLNISEFDMNTDQIVVQQEGLLFNLQLTGRAAIYLHRI